MATDSTDPGDLMIENRMCIWCAKPGDSWNCGSEECLAKEAQELKDLQVGEAQYHRQLEWEGLRSAWKGGKLCYDEENLSAIQKWFYTIKLTACFMMGLRYHGRKSWPNRVQVGCCFFHGDRCNWSGAWINVGRGIVRGWWFYIEHDGDSNM